MNVPLSARLIAGLAAVAVVGACSDTPTVPMDAAAPPLARATFPTGGITIPEGQVGVYVCKISTAIQNGQPDDGTVGKTFVFDASSASGTSLTGVQATAGTGPSNDPGRVCPLVWYGPVGSEVTIAEVGVVDPEVADFTLNVVSLNWSGSPDVDLAARTVTFTVSENPVFNSGSNKYEVRFKNSVLIEPPQDGCTLTIGYWKTHSFYGPATPADPTWDLLPSGPDTQFYLSGQSWIDVFNTPVEGNQYYNLAHQFMGAVLNVLNGASAPGEVTDAIAAANSLFNTYTPAQIAALRGNDPLRAQFVSLAATLDAYNMGEIGPGHCEEASDGS